MKNSEQKFKRAMQIVNRINRIAEHSGSCPEAFRVKTIQLIETLKMDLIAIDCSDS